MIVAVRRENLEPALLQQIPTLSYVFDVVESPFDDLYSNINILVEMTEGFANIALESWQFLTKATQCHFVSFHEVRMMLADDENTLMISRDENVAFQFKSP